MEDAGAMEARAVVAMAAVTFLRRNCGGVASFYGVRCGGSCALHRFARRFKRRWRAEVVAVLVLLLRFPWLLREEEELAVAQGAKMVVAQIPAKCCRFVAVCSRWRSAREDGGVLRVKWRNWCLLDAARVGGDASLQNRGGRKRRWLPWGLMVAARVWGKLGFLFWEMKMMTWQPSIGQLVSTRIVATWLALVG